MCVRGGLPLCHTLSHGNEAIKVKHLLHRLPKPLSRSQTQPSEFLYSFLHFRSESQRDWRAANEPEMTNHCASCSRWEIHVRSACWVSGWESNSQPSILWLVFPPSLVAPQERSGFPRRPPGEETRNHADQRPLIKDKRVTPFRGEDQTRIHNTRTHTHTHHV